jgi:hypothetical protein
MMTQHGAIRTYGLGYPTLRVAARERGPPASPRRSWGSVRPLARVGEGERAVVATLDARELARVRAVPPPCSPNTALTRVNAGPSGWPELSHRLLTIRICSQEQVVT